MPDKVSVSRLSVDCVVGTRECERERPQRILVDFEMACDLSPAADADDLALAPDYARAAGMVRAFCVERRALLMETLAEGIAHRLLAAFAIDSATVRITKPAAIDGAGGASVEITRSKIPCA